LPALHRSGADFTANTPVDMFDPTQRLVVLPD
jgi:hypothetical protein